MMILMYTSLYPGPRRPVHGIFVQELVRAVSERAQVRMVVPEDGLRAVVSPPAPAERLGEEEAAVSRCRFWSVPKFLKSLDGRFMAEGSRRAFGRVLRLEPDLVHAHYAYPDGAAAALLAGEAGLPLVVTCHGSDIHVLAKDPPRRRRIAEALGRAAAVVAVSRDLAGKIAGLGVDPARIHHIPNGVDLARFPLAGKAAARQALGLAEEGPLVVAVGRLAPVKGQDRLLRALALLPDVRLVLAGDGPERQALARLAGKLGIADRVRFAGSVPHEGLAPYYQAADALVLSSHSEGWPTVIHEALACGCPVVAPAVGGIPEALADPDLGIVLESAEPARLAAGIGQALARTWNPDTLRRAALAHDWTTVAARHLALYEAVLGQAPALRKEVFPYATHPNAFDPGTGLPGTASVS